MSSSPAVFEIVENFMMVAKIASQSTRITMSPASGDCSPKKAPDHRALRINWTPKTLTAIFTRRFCKPARQTRNAATPIRVYNVSQTGPNNQLGGVKNGLLSVTYQVETETLVKTAPIKPADWQMSILNTGLSGSGTLIESIVYNPRSSFRFRYFFTSTVMRPTE